jgi:hypothetical protein
LLDLPAELRLQVYGHLLPRPTYLNPVVAKHFDSRPRLPRPRYELAALQTCRQIHNELVDYLYKDKVLVLNVFYIGKARWGFTGLSSRDRQLIFNMRKEARSAFKNLEIRVLVEKDEEDLRVLASKYRRNDGETSYRGNLATVTSNSRRYLGDVLEAFDNVESVTVSFEIDEAVLQHGGVHWSHSCTYLAEFLVSVTSETTRVRWDFRLTAASGLEFPEHMMDYFKTGIAQRIAREGGVLQPGESIMKKRFFASR